jgi:hypothetical protein
MEFSSILISQGYVAEAYSKCMIDASAKLPQHKQIVSKQPTEKQQVKTAGAAIQCPA